jgi:Ca2+-binding EF-hand superfamily protein
MDVDSFKRMFFPSYFQVEKDAQSEVDEREIESEQIVVSKLTKVETLIKDKLAANWVSVRKAFLDLDTDYDGYVTVEDILRVLGEEGRTLDFNDLTKLIIDKDHKRRGRINYTDFSKWLGGVI